MSNEPKHKWQTLKKLSKNPLVNVIAGFMLTVVIAGGIEYYREAQRLDERKRQLKLYSIDQISHLMNERATRAELLGSAIKRNARQVELISRKNGYDSAYIEWNNKLHIIKLRIRTLIDQKKYSETERFIDQGLAPIFKSLDAHLTNNFDARIAGGTTSYDSEKVQTLVKNCRECSKVIIEYLWVGITYPEDKNSISAAHRELVSRCPIP